MAEQISPVGRNDTQRDAMCSAADLSLGMREHHYFIYILTNWNNRVMYVGMTNNLVRRLHEHRTHAVKGFTEKYNVHKLVYFEETADVHVAMAREKEIKKWRREKKNALVIQTNPGWRDVGNDLGQHASPTVMPTGIRPISPDHAQLAISNYTPPVGQNDTLPVIPNEERNLNASRTQDFSQASPLRSGHWSK